MKMNIVAPLRSFTSIYSVAGVMLAQARSPASAGHDATVIVNQSCIEVPVQVRSKWEWNVFLTHTVTTKPLMPCDNA